MSDKYEGVEALKDLLKVQCANGNWNYDAYMHGMANGMILAMSLFTRGAPEFLEAPKVWLESIPNTDKPIAVETK